MTEKIVVANWKANKTLKEALAWVEIVGSKLRELKRKVILCPPAIFIPTLAAKIEENNLSQFLILGSQNVSHFLAGSYTGEITVTQLAGLVKFILVGHSERRRYFGETRQQVAKKFDLAKQAGIIPIFCFDVPEIEEVFAIPDSNLICAYEPISAIGTGNPETPEVAAEIVSQVKSKKPAARVLYGGSVTGENVGKFTTFTDGVLVGTASVNPDDFLEITSNT